MEEIISKDFLVPTNTKDLAEGMLAPPLEIPDLIGQPDIKKESGKKLLAFDPNIVNALLAYLSGSTITVAARNAKVQPKKLKDAIASKEGKDYILSYYAEADQWLRGLRIHALNTIVQQMGSVAPAVRLRAAETILKHSVDVKANQINEDQQASATAVARAIIDKLDPKIINGG